MALITPGFCALITPGLCALIPPGLCALITPGLCALTTPGLCARQCRPVVEGARIAADGLAKRYRESLGGTGYYEGI